MAFLLETLKFPTLIPCRLCERDCSRVRTMVREETLESQVGQRIVRENTTRRSCTALSLCRGASRRAQHRFILRIDTSTAIPKRRILSDVSMRPRTKPGINTWGDDDYRSHPVSRRVPGRCAGRLSGSIVARASATTCTVERLNHTAALLAPLSSA